MDSLQDVAPLVAAFNRAKPFDDGFAPDEPSLAETPTETPAINPASSHRRHFRALDGGLTQALPDAVPLDAQFPVNSQVEMLYVNADESLEWYGGVITRSELAVDAKGRPDLSYSIRFTGESRSRSYKLNRNSLRLKNAGSSHWTYASSLHLARVCTTSLGQRLQSVSLD